MPQKINRPPNGTFRGDARRARDAVRGAVVQVADGDVRVVLDEPALPAPGQACVFYAGEQVLGGGIIVRGDVGAAS